MPPAHQLGMTFGHECSVCRQLVVESTRRENCLDAWLFGHDQYVLCPGCLQAVPEDLRTLQYRHAWDRRAARSVQRSRNDRAVPKAAAPTPDLLREQSVAVPVSAPSETPARPTSAPAKIEPKAPVPIPRRVVDSPLRSSTGSRQPPLDPPGTETRTQNHELLAEVERLRSENQNLRESTKKGTSIKVGTKGGASVYGLGRFPVTLYKQQWERLLATEAEIRQFLLDHESELATKGGGSQPNKR